MSFPIPRGYAAPRRFHSHFHLHCIVTALFSQWRISFRTECSYAEPIILSPLWEGRCVVQQARRPTATVIAPFPFSHSWSTDERRPSPPTNPSQPTRPGEREREREREQPNGCRRAADKQTIWLHSWKTSALFLLSSSFVAPLVGVVDYRTRIAVGG